MESLQTVCPAPRRLLDHLPRRLPQGSSLPVPRQEDNQPLTPNDCLNKQLLQRQSIVEDYQYLGDLKQHTVMLRSGNFSSGNLRRNLRLTTPVPATTAIQGTPWFPSPTEQPANPGVSNLKKPPTEGGWVPLLYMGQGRCSVNYLPDDHGGDATNQMLGEHCRPSKAGDTQGQ